jgi:ribonuclease HII
MPVATRKSSAILQRTRERRVRGIVCGVDEVGRGPLAGPVVAAAVILPAILPDAFRRIDDSKKLSATRREELALAIHDCALVSIGVASVAEIDAINILRASLAAMGRAIAGLSQTPVLALIDGNQKPPVDIACELVIGGDGVELAIAAASIVAKVHRDRLMQDLHTDHPQYGWNRNAGYATALHRAALKRHGACIHHRTSFAPVREALAG